MSVESWYALTPEQIREVLARIKSGPPPAPDIAGLFYRGQTHGLPGKRDAGKSLFMALVTRDLLNAGGRAVWIDHEQGADRVLRRLREFGTDENAIAERFHLILDPLGLTPAETIEAYADEPLDLVVVDAMTGQMSSSGLNDNHAVDVDIVYATLCKPFARLLGAAVVILDHVPHGTSDRPLGSQRKSSAPDVELMFKAVGKFKPGVGGRAKITVGRDRDAAIRPCEFILNSDYSWRLEHAGGDWQPTTLMARVSEYLEAQADEVSKATVERDVDGTAQYLRHAIDELIRQDFVTARKGSRNATLLSSLRAYAPPADATSSTSSAPRRDEVPRHLVDPVVPYRGDGVGVDEVGAATLDLVGADELAWLEQIAATEEARSDDRELP